MNMLKVEDGITRAVDIIQDYYNQLDSEGLRFNIFSILKLQSNEVRLHSAFIAEILNLSGTHGYKNMFCQLFFEGLQEKLINVNLLERFDISNYSVEVEKYTGIISDDYTSGGRIDILLKDKHGHEVIIENKIFALDQPNQLVRYHNYNKKALLLYLTLNGNEPDFKSTNSQLKLNREYYCISYKDFIANWLELCLNKSGDKPRVKQTLAQYLQIIQEYTLNNIRAQMIKDLVNLLKENKELFHSIDELVVARDNLIQDVHNDLQERFEELCSKDLIYKLNGIKIIIWIANEKSKYYYYVYFSNEDGLKPISRIDPKYMELNVIRNELVQNNILEKGFSDNLVGWKNSIYLDEVNTKGIYPFSNRKNQDKLIEQLSMEITEFKRRLHKEISSIVPNQNR